MAATPDSLQRSKVSCSALKRRAAAPTSVALLAFAAVWVVGCAGSKPPAPASASTTKAVEAAPKEEAEDPVPEGPLSKKAIEKIIQDRSDRFQPCYDAGLKKNPSLRGRVTARIVIGNDGRVAASEDGGSSMPDASVVKCVLAGFKKLRFPIPEESFVTVNYPMEFEADQGNMVPASRGTASAESRSSLKKTASAEPRSASKGTASAEPRSTLKSGPFQGCSFAADAGDKSGTKTEIECGSRKLVVTDVPAEASNKAALGHLSRFEDSLSSSAQPKRSSPKLHGKSSWVTVVQDKDKSWGTMVVLAFGKEKTRVVECSGKPNGVSRWCERQITALAKGYSPSGLLYGK